MLLEQMLLEQMLLEQMLLEQMLLEQMLLVFQKIEYKYQSKLLPDIFNMLIEQKSLEQMSFHKKSGAKYNKAPFKLTKICPINLNCLS